MFVSRKRSLAVPLLEFTVEMHECRLVFGWGDFVVHD